MSRHADAVRRAAQAVDVPGAPLSLRLDSVTRTGAGLRLVWSFLDPESHGTGRRLRGELVVPVASGPPEELARQWWAQAQLAAAHRFKQHVDADWIPGEPDVRRVWTPEEAWHALLTHLGAYSEYGEYGPRGPEGAYVRVENGVIHDAETTYLIDPDEWAAYLSDPEPDSASVDASLESATVPAAFPLVDGLPLWAVDELDEVAGSSGPIIGLVDGDLRELEPGEY